MSKFFERKLQTLEQMGVKVTAAWDKQGRPVKVVDRAMESPTIDRGLRVKLPIRYCAGDGCDQVVTGNQKLCGGCRKEE